MSLGALPLGPRFVFVAHGGGLEPKAVLLAASLRATFGECELHAALPDGAAPMSPSAHAALETLGVRRHASANPIGSHYPYGNKIGALGAVDGAVILLDSDILALRPFGTHWSLLAADGAVKPADRDTFTAHGGDWHAAYNAVGRTVPERWITATESGERMRPYYNAGFIAVRDARAAGEAWVATARALESDASVQAKRPWLDQIALAIAFDGLGWTISPADRRLNYPGHIRDDDGSEPYLLHYHDPERIRLFPDGMKAFSRAVGTSVHVHDSIYSHPEWACITDSTI